MNFTTTRTAQLVTLMDHLPVAILIVTDGDGRGMVGNRAARELLGLLPGEDFERDLPPFRTVQAAIAVRSTYLPWQSSARLGMPIGPGDYEVLRRDGTSRIVNVSAAPIRNDDDIVEGVVATLTDVTYLRTQERWMRGEGNLLAALLAREQRISRTLERAHFPRSLPSVPGFVLNALYVAPQNGCGVGGDWYDAFPLSDGRVAFSIGDVMGHGLEAAVMMGRLRSAIHSVAFMCSQPAAMLDAANATLLEHDRDCIATALAGVLDPKDGTITFATAGHPLPLLRKCDGHLVAFEGAAPPLGVYEQGDAHQHFVQVDPGDITVSIPTV